MFKIRLLQRNEGTALIGIGVGFLLLIAVNCAVIFPSLAAAFLPVQQPSHVSAIDTNTIEQAIEYIHGQ